MSRDSYIQHAHRHHPTKGTDPIEGISAGLDVGYYQASELTHASPGQQTFTLGLVSTNNPSVFSVNVGAALVQPGAYRIHGHLDFGQDTSFTTGSADTVEFKCGFPVFPLYTHGSLAGTVIPFTSAATLHLWAVQFTAEIVCDVATEINLILDAPVGSPNSLGEVMLYLEKVRDYDWAF